MRAFSPSRSDGRSDRRVIYELAQDAEPETSFTYDTLQEALQVGLDVEVTRSRVYRAVGAANKTLLREQRRYLQVVPDVGYRIIRADEHLPVAIAKKGQAETYVRRGLEILRQTRMDEIDPAQRTIHEGQLLVFGGLCQAIQESNRRHDRSDALIADLRRRVETLESV